MAIQRARIAIVAVTAPPSTGEKVVPTVLALVIHPARLLVSGVAETPQ